MTAPTSNLPQAIARRNDGAGNLLAAYRSQLQAVIEMERSLVKSGLLKPEQRRVLSREEQRGR
jgi:hypothetical protein